MQSLNLSLHTSNFISKPTYLQQQNRAIAINTYALLWFFYVFIVWFLTTLYVFAQAVVKAMLAHPHQ